MPFYEFKCDECKAVKEVDRPMSEAGNGEMCECGRAMRRIFFPSHISTPQTGRDKVLGTLNKEKGAKDFPGGDMHRPRYEQAMAKGLDPPKTVWSPGFG